MVSLIIPNYNKAKYILETLNSVLKQSSKDWECIIIDDASNDKSIELINKFIYNEDKFILISNSYSKGASACRNQGAQLAKGEYLIFLDSDDLISQKCVENRLCLMRSNRELAFSVFKMGTLYNKIGDSKYVWDSFNPPHLNRFLSHDLPWAICSVIWQREKFFDIGCFNEDFVRLQDVELHTKAIISHLKYFIFDDENIDCYYRIDNERVKESYYQLLEEKLLSSMLFVDSFNKLLFENELSYKSKFLKGTLFKILSEIYSAHYLKLISNKNHKYLLKVFIKNYTRSGLFSKIDLFIIKIYMKINLVTRFKGLNYFFNKFLIR